MQILKGAIGAYGGLRYANSVVLHVLCLDLDRVCSRQRKRTAEAFPLGVRARCGCCSCEAPSGGLGYNQVRIKWSKQSHLRSAYTSPLPFSPVVNVELRHSSAARHI